MDAKKFLAANEEFIQGRPFYDANKYNGLRVALHKAAAPEHAGKNIGTSMSDQMECSCGWKSAGYWDGAEYA